MEKYIYNKQNCLWYELQGDYYIPCLELPVEKEERTIGVWGQRHLRYIRQYKKVFYTNLLTSSKLQSHWQWEYQRKGFIRWTIIDKNTHHAIGTIELFNRQADDYFNNCGLLRLDLRSDYEHAESIFDILSLITQPAFELFDCNIIATKVPCFASERKIATEKLGFTASEEKLVGGHDQKVYTDYYVLQK